MELQAPYYYYVNSDVKLSLKYLCHIVYSMVVDLFYTLVLIFTGKGGLCPLWPENMQMETWQLSFVNRFLVCVFLFGMRMSQSWTAHFQYEISKGGLIRGGWKVGIISNSLN